MPMFRQVVAVLLLGLLSPVGAAGPKTEIVGHRGASHDAPEDTVAAIKLAWEQKADVSEFDMWLTRDGKIVVLHDASTKRTAGVDRKVAEHTLAELRTLDVGRWKGPQFAGEKIPTLEEMLATVPPGKQVHAEIKCGPEIIPELDRVLKASGLKPEQTLITSFSADTLAAVKKARPDLPTSWIVRISKRNETAADLDALVTKAKAIRASGLNLSVSDAIDAEFVGKMKAAGLRLDVWTVDDPAEARRLARIGVDGILTNRPGWLREQLTAEPPP
jgi:glycerophosphoryl diester phosphodiesterase